MTVGKIVLVVSVVRYDIFAGSLLVGWFVNEPTHTFSPSINHHRDSHKNVHLFGLLSLQSVRSRCSSCAETGHVRPSWQLFVTIHAGKTGHYILHALPQRVH